MTALTREQALQRLQEVATQFQSLEHEAKQVKQESIMAIEAIKTQVAKLNVYQTQGFDIQIQLADSGEHRSLKAVPAERYEEVAKYMLFLAEGMIEAVEQLADTVLDHMKLSASLTTIDAINLSNDDLQCQSAIQRVLDKIE